MTLKNAALLGLAGMLLLTALLVIDLFTDILHVLGGLVPAVILFRSLIYTFAGLSVTVFFVVFYRVQG
jgi:hypothetical protein